MVRDMMSQEIEIIKNKNQAEHNLTAINKAIELAKGVQAQFDPVGALPARIERFCAQPTQVPSIIWNNVLTF